MKSTIKQTVKAGFTLVELAIVLVIIGLIVGGVLVGQDLIKAAEIRATMADVESYNAASTTFRNKYGGLPGDLLSSRATQYGLTMGARDGTAGNGDGNSLIEGCAANETIVGCETTLFWVDLTSAQLIPHAFNDAAADDAVASLAASADFAPYLPAVPLRDTAYVHVFPLSGRNYFYVGGMASTTAGGLATTAAALTPSETIQIDEKADDGLPETGIIRAVTDFTATGIGLDTTDESCVDTTPTPDVYNNNTDAEATAVTCRIYYRASF